MLRRPGGFAMPLPMQTYVNVNVREHKRVNGSAVCNKPEVFATSPKPLRPHAVIQHVQEIQGLPDTDVKGQDSTRKGFPG